jgi:hypothetical protein
VYLLQVQEGPACVSRALAVVAELCLPFGNAIDPLWQRPFNATSLLLPPVLDSCFTLLGKLATSTGSGAGSSSSSNSSRSSRAPQFGKERATVSSAELVSSLAAGPFGSRL